MPMAGAPAFKGQGEQFCVIGSRISLLDENLCRQKTEGEIHQSTSALSRRRYVSGLDLKRIVLLPPLLKEEPLMVATDVLLCSR